MNTAVQTKPTINYKPSTGIPLPANTGVNYPSRNYTPLQRWAEQGHAHELSIQLKEDKENLREFGESIARAIHSNRTRTELTMNEIKRSLPRYATKKPHTRSETGTGRRSDLLELLLNKKSSNYEPLMQAIRKWQDNLRNICP